MPKELSINIGFITNSSSIVHYFPKELLSHPKIAAFIKSFEINNGFVGSDVWDRRNCGSFAVTIEQKTAIKTDFKNMESYVPSFDLAEDEDVIIYGDEYPSIASTLSHMINEIAKEKGIETNSFDYN